MHRCPACERPCACVPTDGLCLHDCEQSELDEDEGLEEEDEEELDEADAEFDLEIDELDEEEWD